MITELGTILSEESLLRCQESVFEPNVIGYWVFSNPPPGNISSEQIEIASVLANCSGSLLDNNNSEESIYRHAYNYN